MSVPITDTKLTVTDSKSSFELTRRNAIDLELKLNVTAYGHTWRPIGDHLYDFGACKLGASNMLVIETVQYEFLDMLRTKNGWEECKNLH